jgi:hypothetical protein
MMLMLMLVLGLGLSFDASNALAQQEALEQQLIGTWVLVSNDNIAADGN